MDWIIVACFLIFLGEKRKSLLIKRVNFNYDIFELMGSHFEVKTTPTPPPTKLPCSTPPTLARGLTHKTLSTQFHHIFVTYSNIYVYHPNSSTSHFHLQTKLTFLLKYLSLLVLFFSVSLPLRFACCHYELKAASPTHARP